LYPTQLPGEALAPSGWQGGFLPEPPPMALERRILREEVLEGRLFIRAVDPYNFYWLPGSKLNRWVGTLEEIELPKYELLRLADEGVLDPEKVRRIGSRRIHEANKQSTLRFAEPTQANGGPTADVQPVTLLEFYGPLVIDGKLIEQHAHVVIANDDVLLLPGEGWQRNPFWHQKPPYVAFSPLSVPFRTDGVGLIEMVRAIDKGLSKLANLSIDTLMYRLLPLFEINLEAYENPEDFETGLQPGKMFRRNGAFVGQPGITPVEFQDISQGAVQVQAALDRFHQEGALVSEIQQGLPRYRGVQTATEISEKAENQESFFGAMAADIEAQALAPMVDMASDLIMQFIDTANDPRVAAVLGVGAATLQGLSREELLELVVGDYKVKATGITGQLEKAEMLQNLVQFMNLIGQNPEAWLPYINQDKLLQRILEAFRPAIHDIEQIIATPEVAEANRAAMANAELTPELLRLMPQMVQMAAQGQAQQQQAAQAAQQMALQAAEAEAAAAAQAEPKPSAAAE
jgi:hypothetical protein